MEQEEMPQLCTLNDLSLRYVCQHLYKTCLRLDELSHQQSMEVMVTYAKQTIRPYYAILPTCLRSEIIKEINNLMWIYYDDYFPKLIPYLLAILFNRNMKQLLIISSFCCSYCCDHQKQLFKQLEEGIGLESLIIKEHHPSLLEFIHSTTSSCCPPSFSSFTWKLLDSALLNMRNLLSLTIQHVATDELLDIVGKTCLNLVMLDVSYSKLVTTTGIRNLLFPVKLRDRIRLEIPEKNHYRPSITCEDCSCSRERLLITLNKNLIHFELEKKEKSNKFDGKINSLCHILKILNINDTNVNVTGILHALMYIPQLESISPFPLGELVDIICVYQDLYTEISYLNIPFNLTEASFDYLESSYLEFLTYLCPNLKKLSICLYSEDFTFFNIYLQNSNLHELTIKNYTVSITLKEILRNCFNLHTLVFTSSLLVTWKVENDPLPLKHLKKIKLDCEVSAVTIMKLLLLVPELTTLHILKCDKTTLTNEYFKQLLKPFTENNRNVHISSRKLTCFYIHEHNISSLFTFLAVIYTKQLKQLGNLKTLQEFDLLNWNFTNMKLLIPNLCHINLCNDAHFDKFFECCEQL